MDNSELCVLESLKNLASWFIGDLADAQTEAMVFFAAPLGDGEGCKRYVGGMAEVCAAAAMFVERLYADGGKLIVMHLRRDPGDERGTLKLTGDDWERETGKGGRQ